MKRLTVRLIICLIITALVASTIVITSAAATLPNPRIVKGGLTVGYIWLGPVADLVKRHIHQAKIDCAHRGWKLLDTVATDAASQREAFKTYISSNVDAIVLTYVSMQALEDLIIEARQKGIGVYCVDTELRPGVLCDVTSGQGTAAAELTYWCMNRLNYKGKYAIITYSVEQAERERRDVVKAICQNFPGMELVAQQDMTTIDPVKANEYVTQWLTKFGKDLKWICCVTDLFSVPASAAVEAAGFSRKDVFITGMDGGNPPWGIIAKGGALIATASQPAEWYTHYTFECISQVQKQGIMPGTKGSVIPPSLMLLGKQTLVTPDNLPKVGADVNSLFWYYNAKDKKGWWFWKEAGGPYKVDF